MKYICISFTGPKSRCHRGHTPSGGSRGVRFPAFFASRPEFLAFLDSWTLRPFSASSFLLHLAFISSLHS